MNESRAMFPLAAMCRVLGLSPSGCYDWLTRPPSDRARRDIELQGKILLIWGGSGETYGCPRIHAELQAAGERVSRKRVARLMKDLGIQGVTRRRFKTATTRKDAKARPAPDLVNRNFSAEGPDQLWVADITQVRTWAGWLYLAVVLDAWSRRIVGWAMAPHMRAELVEGALAMAISNRKPKGRVVHHSDRGSLSRFKGSSQQYGIEGFSWALDFTGHQTGERERRGPEGSGFLMSPKPRESEATKGRGRQEMRERWST